MSKKLLVVIFMVFSIWGGVLFSQNITYNIEGEIATDPENYSDFFVNDNYIYGVAGQWGMDIFDVSDPSTPFLAGHLDLSNYEIPAVFVKDNYAYIGAGSEFIIVDVTTPASPAIIERYSVVNESLGFIGDLYASSNYLFVLDESSGVHVYDISNPEEPFRVEFLPIWVDAARGNRGMVNKGNFLLVNSSENGVVIIDISDPTDLKWVNSIPNNLFVYTQDKFLFTANMYNEMKIYDITDPGVPIFLSTQTLQGDYPDYENWKHLYVGGNIVFMGVHPNTLFLDSIWNPASPSIVFTLSIQGTSHPVALRGKYLYVHTNYEGTGKFQILGLRGIVVLSHTTNEALNVKTSTTLAWGGFGVINPIQIALIKDGVNIGRIVSGLAPETQSYIWTISDFIGTTPLVGSNFRFQVKESLTLFADKNDSIFPINGLVLTSPNWGELWQKGTTHAITWSFRNVAEPLYLILFRNGVRVGQIAGNINYSSGTYNWNVGNYIGGTAVAGTGYSIRIRNSTGSIMDQSNKTFTITE